MKIVIARTDTRKKWNEWKIIYTYINKPQPVSDSWNVTCDSRDWHIALSSLSLKRLKKLHCLMLVSNSAIQIEFVRENIFQHFFFNIIIIKQTQILFLCQIYSIVNDIYLYLEPQKSQQQQNYNLSLNSRKPNSSGWKCSNDFNTTVRFSAGTISAGIMQTCIAALTASIIYDVMKWEWKERRLVQYLIYWSLNHW